MGVTPHNLAGTISNLDVGFLDSLPDAFLGLPAPLIVFLLLPGVFFRHLRKEVKKTLSVQRFTGA